MDAGAAVCTACGGLPEGDLTVTPVDSNEAPPAVAGPHRDAPPVVSDPPTSDEVSPVVPHQIVACHEYDAPPRNVHRVLVTVVLVGAVANLVRFPVFGLVDEMDFESDPIKGLAIMTAASLFYPLLLLEFTAVSLWLVLAPLRGIPRIGVGLAVALLWLGCFFLSALLSLSEYVDMESGFVIILITVSCLPALFVAFAIPLWLLIACFGWRIEPIARSSAGDRPSLTILDIMIVTAVIAVALGLVRFLAVTALDGWGGLIMGMLFMYGLFVTIGTVLSVVPCLWAGLRWPPAKYRLLLVIGLHLVPTLLYVALATSLAVHASEGFEQLLALLWTASLPLLCVGLYLTMLLVPLIAIRRCGYCLRWRSE
ncbi:MAG: hypothetical protein DWQ42_00985 [Planctomycetota bacterium]|nr:MAG: hypothetical protein DWQ42_00985 [Planctomycetota bacterium]REK43582.1 MAG: hypothetical protein DWQ46_10870 [Planctomycetota bacterium]